MIKGCVCQCSERQSDPRVFVHSREAGSNSLELSVVIPCLNESLTLGPCIKKAQATIDRLGIHGKVIIADNGSTDGSQSIAERARGTENTVRDQSDDDPRLSLRRTGELSI